MELRRRSRGTLRLETRLYRLIDEIGRRSNTDVSTIAAIGIVVWLMLRASSSRGIGVTLILEDAAGMSDNNTKVLYRGLQVGTVSDLALAPDGRHVIAHLDIDRDMSPYIHSGTRFYVEGAHPSFSDPASLKAVISGPTIEVVPDAPPYVSAVAGLRAGEGRGRGGASHDERQCRGARRQPAAGAAGADRCGALHPLARRLSRSTPRSAPAGQVTRMKRIAVLDLAAPRTAPPAAPLATPRVAPRTAPLAKRRTAPLSVPLTVLRGALLAALLTGCASSPPSRFYELNAVAPEATAPAAVSPSPAAAPSQSAAPLQVPVRVAAVHIPPVLDRTEIVRRGPGNELEISGLNRWGAPLDEMVQRVLTQDLLERLPPDRVVLPSGPAPAHTGQIVVDILQLQSDAAGAVVFEGTWSLLESGSSAPSVIRDIHYSETSRPGDYGGQAAAISRMLGHLADDIASTLQQH